ncbi:MAG: polysaccharide deacetylase, partial [Chloroflexota bacterium]
MPRVIPLQITLGPQLSEGVYALAAALRDEEIAAEVEIRKPLLALADRLFEPEAAPVPIVDPTTLGQTLGRALFTDELRELMLRGAREAAEVGARLQIRLHLAAYELAALPWEWLTLGKAHRWAPALHLDYPLVRITRRTRPAPPAPGVPLRVLAIAARGEGPQLEALEAALAEELDAGLVALRLLEDATPSALERALAAGGFHVLHLAAPVLLTRDERLEVAIGSGVDSSELADMLLDAEELRLVSFTGEHGRRREGRTARLAVGPGLLGSIVMDAQRPASIAFAGPLTPEYGAIFSAACYAELAQGAPVDLAVTLGRQALVARAGTTPVPLPQLRMLPGAERLFELRQAPA